MTYLLLIAIFGTASLALLLVARRRLAPGAVQAMLLAFVALSALTIVFDSLMIAADLFSYGPGTTGIRLWLAPVEGERVLLPLRIAVRTMLGTNIIEATRFDRGGTTGDTAQAAAQ